MNAADDKEKTTKPNKNNEINTENAASSSKTCSENRENTIPTVKLNGSSPQNSDCNKPIITNGAYPTAKSISSGVSSAFENHGPSELRNNNIKLVLPDKSENSQSEISCGENEKNLLLRNKVVCHPENDNRPVIVQKTYKPKEISSCEYDKNSSSEDEECCIYTYKGDSNQMADLPSSFFRLDVMPSRHNPNSRNSSPDMDYLEMDFDPGPSHDRYSSSDSECGDQRESETQFQLDGPSLLLSQSDCEPMLELAIRPDINSPTPLSPLSTPSPVWCSRPQSSPEQPHPSGSEWSPSSSPLRPSRLQEADREDLQPSYCYCVANKLSPVDENFNEGETGTMIWKEQEAREKQVNQIGTSLSSATAVINTLLALNVQFSVNTVKQLMAPKMRNETAPLVEYLLSRSCAGATHVDIIRSLEGASQGLIFAKFFHMYPQRSISLTSWLSHWIKKGAIPIATLNLQRGLRSDVEVPDWWRHQMIYGVGAHGIYLTNPLEVQSEAQLSLQLASPSVLLVRRDDVLSHWTPDSELHQLIQPTLPLWRKMNVLGQVVNVIREDSKNSHSSQYITIPASYSSGITLAILKTSPAYEELRFAPELPVDPFASR